MFNVTKYFKPALKVYWWRLNEDRGGPGNFGDEITKEIIEKIFKRRVEWSPFEHCQLIGAGSIIEEVTENKGNNRPYLWCSGFIQPGDLTISSKDFTIVGVRGKESLKRVVDPRPDIALGDPAILASFLLDKKPKKQYRLGVLPHYTDADNPFVASLAQQDNVHIIDPLRPCTEVVNEIAKCEALLSSTLHGLITADSLSVPNLHFKLGDKLKGGLYKFNDYYSIYNSERYQQVTPEALQGRDVDQIHQQITRDFTPIPTQEMELLQSKIMKAFPF